MIEHITSCAHTFGAPIDKLCDAICIPRATYYRRTKCVSSDIKIISSPPKNALSGAEKQAVLDILHSEEFVDKTPYETYATLLDKDQYYCSIRTMYRLLEQVGENQERRRQRCHRNTIKPELIACKPNQVWSWDITKLLGKSKWQYFYLYVILDIFSRYVVGWMIADRESGELARTFIQKTCLKQGIQPHQLTLHSDRGSSMKSITVAQLLAHLGVTKTHSRPYVSDDNPFSESQFKTMKYSPDFPGRFENLNEGEKFSQHYFRWYNNDHYHSSLCLLTPYQVHYGEGEKILKQRHQTMMKAFEKNPARFRNKAPKELNLPKAVWINPPTESSNLSLITTFTAANEEEIDLQKIAF